MVALLLGTAMKSFFVLSTLSLALLTGCSSEKISVSNEAKQEKINTLLGKLSENKTKVEKVFDGPDDLTGVVALSDNGQKAIIWASKNGDVLLPGPAFDQKGDVLNETLRIEQGLGGNFSMILASTAEKESKAIIQGQSGRILTAFIDPNCIHCHTFFKEIQPLVQEGNIRIRYVLTGFLNESSEGKAAAILSAPNPLDALIKAEQNYDETKHSAGIEPLKTIPKNLQSSLKRNVDLLQLTGKMATPYFMFCDEHGQLQEVTGLPDVKKMVQSAQRAPDQSHPACINSEI